MIDEERNYEILENISCDKCGYYDNAEKFLDLETKEGIETLLRFGFDTEKQTKSISKLFYKIVKCFLFE